MVYFRSSFQCSVPMKTRHRDVFYYEMYLSRGIKAPLVNCRLKLKQHEPLRAIYFRGLPNKNIVFPGIWICIIRFDGLETWHFLTFAMPCFFTRCLQCSSPRSLANSYALISIRISRDNNISRDRMVIKLHYADICWRLRHQIIG